MRIRRAGLVIAFLVPLFALNQIAHAGIFGGNSELGIIKKNSNTFVFLAPDGEVLDDSSLQFAAARTAKLLGYSHFVIEIPVEKPLKKSKPVVKAEGETAPEVIAEEPKPKTMALVYFYNSARSRNGVKSIPVTDIFPDEAQPASAEAAPVAEPAKPAPKKSDAAQQDILLNADVAPIPEKKSKPPKQESAPVEQASAPVEPTPAPVIEKKSKRVKQDVAPVEAANVTVEPAPMPEKKSKPAKQESALVEQESAPAVEPNKIAEQPSLQEIMQTKSSPATNAPLPQADVAFEEQVEPAKKSKPRKKRIIWPGDQSPFPNSGGRVNELGDMFN